MNPDFPAKYNDASWTFSSFPISRSKHPSQALHKMLRIMLEACLPTLAPVLFFFPIKELRLEYLTHDDGCKNAKWFHSYLTGKNNW